eukprot:TRINITY_DN24070_c0_g1_i1.p1 TRINITY_DN24070_c0_g1~~TRINITY_DN24070_c0_g1_i1.p1  ORF type:complete len:486 (+),score=97.83 TRINITY_DN24070_c0_g1_i1:184-1458(+)
MKVFGLRWLMLALYIPLYFICVFMWFSYGKLWIYSTGDFRGGFHIAFSDGILVGLFLLEMVMLALVVLMIKFLDLRKTLCICAALSIISGIFGLVGSSLSLGWANLISIFLVMLSVPFLFVSPSLFISIWFGENERTLASGLIFSIGWHLPIGLSSYFLPSWIQNESKFQLATSSLLIIIGVFNFFFHKEGPMAAPSITALTEKEDILVSLKSLYKYKSFLLHTFTWSIIFAVYYCFCIQAKYLFMDDIVDHSSSISTVSVGITTLSSCIFTIISGIIVDRYKNFKMMIILSAFGSTLSILIIVVFFTDIMNRIYIYTGSAFLGLFSALAFSVGLEFGVELSFPMKEQLSTLIMMMVTKVLCLSLFYAVPKLSTVYSPSIGLFTLGLLLFIAGICSLFIKPEYKRLFFEVRSLNKQKDSSLFSI